MPFWAGRAAAASNLRLYVSGAGWRSFSDSTPDDDGTSPVSGAKGEIESAILNALNATNLMILTGAGASFAASNPDSALPPAGMRELWDAVEKAVGQERFAEIIARFGQERVGQNIEKLLTLCKLHLELHAPDAGDDALSPFVTDAERAILDRVDFVSHDTNLDAHASFIRKVGRRSIRKPRAKLFTTNYDLCFEEAARRHRFTVIDGFSHGLDPTYDRQNFEFDIVRREAKLETPDYIQNVLKFYKLHGSLDWRRLNDEIIRTRQRVGDPVIIYPRFSKYQESFEAPYLHMLSSLQSALAEPDSAMVVSGFGFNDSHISGPILSAIESNMSLRLLVCDPIFVPDDDLAIGQHELGTVPAPANSIFQRLLRLADCGDARIHLLNGRFEDLVLAMPDLLGETDRERHVERMRVVREASGRR